MVNPGLPRPTRLVAEVLGTGSIPAELAAILVEHSRTVRKDGTARTPEERTGGGLYAILLHLALGEVPVPGLVRVTLVGVDEDGRVHLMHLLFSVRINVYSTECHIFACLGELPSEGLPQVTEILPGIFRGTALCLRHSAHGPHFPPGRDLPSPLADEAMQACRKGCRDRPQKLGLPGLGVPPGGLRGVASWERG